MKKVDAYSCRCSLSESAREPIPKVQPLSDIFSSTVIDVENGLGWVPTLR